MEQKTPLYERHVALGGKMVPFAGYLLPVQYAGGVIAEHMAVRKTAGLFDVSHMGEIIFSGPEALAALNYLLTNDFTGMALGQARYSPMCNPAGGILDDVIVYRIKADTYMVVVNAANRAKDAAWMMQNAAGFDAAVCDRSDDIAQIALQGPNAHAILCRLADEAALPRKYYTCKVRVDVAGKECIVSRTGYTGELGYEIYCANEDAVFLWDALLEAGQADGLTPCGLGARDTLRLEAAMPLYGHEMDETVLPLETALGFAVKMQKDNFIGKAALADAQISNTRVGLKAVGRGIAREGCDVYARQACIGRTTSGTHSPYLGYPIAMAIIDSAYAHAGDEVSVMVRGKPLTMQIVPLPFYKK